VCYTTASRGISSFTLTYTTIDSCITYTYYVPLSCCPTTIVQMSITTDATRARIIKAICTVYPLAKFGASIQPTTDNKFSYTSHHVERTRQWCVVYLIPETLCTMDSSSPGASRRRSKTLCN